MKKAAEEDRMSELGDLQQQWQEIKNMDVAQVGTQAWTSTVPSFAPLRVPLAPFLCA